MVHILSFLVSICGLAFVLGFDNSRNDNIASYWGQNSYGATHTSDTANWQKSLAFYCADNSIDALPIAFLDVFSSTGRLPSINLANICSDANDPVFPGTDLPNCQFLATDIQTCQSKGKIVTISLGGASGGGTFTSASQARGFGTTIWNLFLGGSSSTRPFGNAVLDGVDLDIEGGGTEFFDSFIGQIRSHAAGSSKNYYFTAAPQCPFPDANLDTVLNAASFDAVYVQFYNNFCGLTNFNNSNNWNFNQWDTWAKTTSKNPNVKIYIGAPASSTAAGSGYIDASTLGSIIQQTRSTYSSFGGIMLWDASQAYMNNRFDAAIKAALTNGGGVTPPSSSTTTPPKTTSTPPPPPPTSTPSTSSTSVGSGSCAGVQAWSSSVAYVGGSQVVSNGHLWTAKRWSEADVPGGVAGDWTDDGPCTAAAIATAAASGGAPPHAVAPPSASISTITRSPKFTPNMSPTPTSSSPPSSGSCAGVSTWSKFATYNAGENVTFKNHLWTAKGWTTGDLPGGSAQVWTDDGPCVIAAITTTVPEFVGTSQAKETSIIANVSHGDTVVSNTKLTTPTTSIPHSRFFRL